MVWVKVANVATWPLQSSPIRPDQCADKAVSFASRLAAYREALAAQGLTVAATWIHFPLAASMAKAA